MSLTNSLFDAVFPEQRPFRYVTIAYILALSLVACLSIISHALLHSYIYSHEQAARIINVSGRQRMLSQRIEASAIELSQARDATMRHEIETRMASAIELMERSHNALTQGSKAMGIAPVDSPELTAIYRSPPYRLDEQVTEYLGFARAFLALPPDQQAGSPQLQGILKAAHGPILTALDAAVSGYQRDSEARIVRVDRVTDGFLVITLSTLLLEAIVIFRPLFRQILRRATEYRRIIETSLDGFWVVDGSGYVRDANDAQCRMLDYPREELLGRAVADIEAQESADAIAARLRQIKECGYVRFETRHKRKDGAFIDVEASVVYVPELGERFFAFTRDISERKATEASLHLAASVFSHANEGITITDADGTILDVNESFMRVTGYSRDEAIGQNPRILQSGRQTNEFYADMWRSLADKGHWFGEIWNRRRTGEIYPELLSINAVRDAEGNTKNYVALFTDITTIKEHQKQLEFIAHYDSLTGLPNRVLLADRIHQAIGHSSRRSRILAVAYIDLDGFKEINDGHGHEIGDRLLATVSQRMKGMLRAGDTLARIGGDEFVALLTDVDHAEDC